MMKMVTHYARDPKVVTAAGVVIMSTMKIWEDVTNYPEEKPKDPNKLDLDWLGESEDYMNKC